MAMMLAAERDVKLGPLKASQVSAALNRLGGAGYGLIGEALLERVGLGYMFKTGRPPGLGLPRLQRRPGARTVVIPLMDQHPDTCAFGRDARDLN